MVLLLSCMTAPEEDAAPACSGDVALALAHQVEGEWAPLNDVLNAPLGPGGGWPGYLRLTTWNTKAVVDVSLQLGGADPRLWQIEQSPTDEECVQTFEHMAAYPDQQQLCATRDLTLCVTDATSTTCERWTVLVDNGAC